MNTYRDAYIQWCTSPLFDAETKAELKAIEKDEAEIQDRFYRELSFGTGGLRGVLGAGTNRMNRYTVGKATQGLADYIKEQAGEKKVAIAYDSRNRSQEFALCAALCLCANGIEAYLFPELRPTPELSFAVRELDCMAGIVITASHNPAEYNGYKVYWSDGCQITPPRDSAIIARVNAVPEYEAVKTVDRQEALEKGLLHIIGPELDDAYIKAVKAQILHQEIIKAMGDALSIVYTPLHGTGLYPVTRMLRELGFRNVYVVEEQAVPDGNFPTVPYPNPEEKAAFALAMKLAEEKQADLVLATDPDADRLGVAVRDGSGAYHMLTGNMSGMLLCEYELSQRKALGRLPEDAAVVKTIVTGNMSKKAAKAYGVHVDETLTGFKYIGQKIKEYEDTGSHTYVFGYEESYGCLIGTYARDKDAVVAVTALCEAAAWYKAQGSSLWDQMIKLYEKYGYFMEDLMSVTYKGADGAEKIAALMERLRRNPLEKLGPWQVLSVTDYLDAENIGLPRSNVLYYRLEEDGWMCMRPSGTEPKIKLYMGVKGAGMEDGARRLAALKEAARRLTE